MYLSAPLVFISLYSGGAVIRIASVSGSFSIKARPFSAPRTITAVDRASAVIASLAIIVTLANLLLLEPVLVSIMWLYLLPCIKANRR